MIQITPGLHLGPAVIRPRSIAACEDLSYSASPYASMDTLTEATLPEEKES